MKKALIVHLKALASSFGGALLGMILSLLVSLLFNTEIYIWIVLLTMDLFVCNALRMRLSFIKNKEKLLTEKELNSFAIKIFPYSILTEALFFVFTVVVILFNL